MKVGYFGGTFDPPHIGHIILSVETMYQLELNDLYWILTPDPPHKNDQPLTPVQARLEMLELIQSKYPELKLSYVDLNRKPPHYAADTVEILKNENPSWKLVYLIGEDSLCDLPDWHEPKRFLQNVDLLAVTPRPFIKADLNTLETTLPGIKKKVVHISGTLIQVSSSGIRQRIRINEPFSHYLTPEVYQYILDNNLYR
jgi:nicotinate-nucleotide adenylyltransferase